MTSKAFKTVDAYVSALPEDVRAVLQRVRAAIRKALPDAEEAISYQIPTYKLRGRPVIYFAGWREHYSVYPAPATLIAALPELAPYKVSKGTLRFPLSEPVPVKLIGRLAKLRASEVVGRAAARPASKKRSRH
jgi:uncharacterized protein YdhG (YjbR/CyaY superfamily)